MRTIIVVILGGLALIIIGLILIRPPAESKKEITIDKKPGFQIAPEFSLKDISKAEKKLSDFRGKVVIIDFWATWCPPCKEEIPHFISLYNQYKDQGLEIIGVSMDQNPEKILPRFIEANNINYTILLGDEQVYDSYGGIIAIPTTFILDKDGNIRKKYLGYNEKEVFEKEIKELL
jgi:peroxiredoxin